MTINNTDISPCSCGQVPLVSNHEGSAIHISCRCGLQLWGAKAHFNSEEACISEWNSRQIGCPISGLEIAGYEGSSGLYYSRLAAVANGEQSVEPVYRVKK